ncbi:MAG: hypothetical protein V3V49_14010 [Candidatus Krumholzibacteria bacterium]
MKPHTVVLAMSLLMFCVAGSFSEATQVLHRSPQQLGQQSSLVVRGTVAGVRSFWNDKHTKFFTETEITVDQSYKGEQSPSVRQQSVMDGVELLGGAAPNALKRVSLVDAVPLERFVNRTLSPN